MDAGTVKVKLDVDSEELRQKIRSMASEAAEEREEFAMVCLERAADADGEERGHYLAEAQVHATLAMSKRLVGR